MAAVAAVSLVAVPSSPAAAQSDGSGGSDGADAAPTYKAVDSGGQYACAIRADNTVICWGYNSQGETNAPADKSTAVSAGQAHTCAIRADRTVACWGANWQGKADAPNGEFSAVSAGGEHSCGIRADRTVACWGHNEHGQTDTPDGEFTAVSAGQAHTCAIRTDRTVACWGHNWRGRADAPNGEFSAVSAGGEHSCGIRADRTIACWGNDSWGLIDAPVGEFTHVTAGEAHTCAIRTDRTIACWGDNGSGRADAPNGSFTDITAGGEHSCGLNVDGTIACWGAIDHDLTAEPAGTYAKIVAGRDHTCGIRTDGTVTCWGVPANGRTYTPAAPRFTHVTAGRAHTCGMQADRTVTCWGDSSHGQADAPDGEFADIAAGSEHSCGIRTDNTVTCWGNSWLGRTDAPNGEFTHVTAGEAHTCAIRTDHTIACWGSNWSGQADAPNGSFTDIAAGGEHSCGLSADGAVVCWGIETVALPAGVERFVHPRGPDPSVCRPYGTNSTTAGFPLPGFALASTGTLKVAVVFVDFPDAAARHSTHEEAAQSLEHAERYLESVSYGRLDVQFDPLHRWLRASDSYEEYQADGILGAAIQNLIDNVAAALADPYVDFSEYDLMVVVMPSTHFGGGNAIGTARSEEGPITTTRVNTNRKPPDQTSLQGWGGTAFHEILHNLGLLDLYSYDISFYERPEAPSGQAWVFTQFGVMGLVVSFVASDRDPRLAHAWRRLEGFNAQASEMLAWSRWQLGWLDADQVRCISGAQATVGLRAVAAPGNATAMAAIPLSGSELIVIESRRKINHDDPQLLEEGVLVYTVDASVGSGALSMRVAGDSGNGQVDDYPILRTGESVTVQGFTIRVVSDDGHTHTVEIARQN